jgi:hypothetical protein
VRRACTPHPHPGVLKGQSCAVATMHVTDTNKSGDCAARASDLPSAAIRDRAITVGLRWVASDRPEEEARDGSSGSAERVAELSREELHIVRKWADERTPARDHGHDFDEIRHAADRLDRYAHLLRRLHDNEFGEHWRHGSRSDRSP